jgi:hypothetical protein
MFRRLCMFLLIACLAAPAIAAPLHCGPLPVVEVAAHPSHHSDREAPSERAAKHDCIGCIAPLAAAVAPAEVPFPSASRKKPISELRIAGNASGPDTPPPRT